MRSPSCLCVQLCVPVCLLNPQRRNSEALCVCVYSFVAARQLLSKHVPVAANTTQ
jgi:hypothetical protein